MIDATGRDAPLGPDAGCRLVLASASPRRRMLVTALDVRVEVADPDVDEGPPLPGEPAERYVSRLSLLKARAWDGGGPAVVVGADTAVVIGDEILGKPSDREEASRMLAALRGRMHTVYTGVTVLRRPSGEALQAACASSVHIRAYSDAEVAEYLDAGTYMDKAGAYAVQDDLLRPAERVEGCYLNAMGFPLCQVATLLGKVGVRARLRPGRTLPEQCVECSLREPDGGAAR